MFISTHSFILYLKYLMIDEGKKRKEQKDSYCGGIKWLKYK